MKKRYGTKLRPAGIGCQPKDFIKLESADKKKDGYWSIVTYNRKLTEEEIYKYDLIEIKEKE